MKKLFLTTVTFLILTLPLLAQNNIWSLPPNYYKFPTGPTQLLPTQTGSIIDPVSGNSLSNYDGAESAYTHNAMQDANGNLLFFIVDGVIYDKEGYVINELRGVACDPCGGFSETAIVPVPGNCNQFYIIGTHIRTQNSHYSPWIGYALLDMSLTSTITNRKGMFVNIDSNGSLPYSQADFGDNTLFNLGATAPDYTNGATLTEGYGGVAVTKLRSDNTRFLYFSGEQYVYQFSISAAGIVYGGYKFAINNLGHPQHGDRSTRTEMEIVKLYQAIV